MCNSITIEPEYEVCVARSPQNLSMRYCMCSSMTIESAYEVRDNCSNENRSRTI